MRLENARGQEDQMEGTTPDFSLDVQGVKGFCPVGETFHRRYGDLFSMDDVPEQELKAVARQVADQIIATLKRSGEVAGDGSRKE